MIYEKLDISVSALVQLQKYNFFKNFPKDTPFQNWISNDKKIPKDTPLVFGGFWGQGGGILSN